MLIFLSIPHIIGSTIYVVYFDKFEQYNGADWEII